MSAVEILAALGVAAETLGLNRPSALGDQVNATPAILAVTPGCPASRAGGSDLGDSRVRSTPLSVTLEM
jgi:hypothetical protein